MILRAVFGLDPGERLDALRERLTEILEFGAPRDAAVPAARPRPRREFERLRAETDALIYETIDERRGRRRRAHGDDVLAMLLAARHEDGSPMSPRSCATS